MVKRLSKAEREAARIMGSKGGQAFKAKLTKADRKAIGKRLAEARAKKRKVE